MCVHNLVDQPFSSSSLGEKGGRAIAGGGGAMVLVMRRDGLTRISEISCRMFTAVFAEACLFSSCGGGGMIAYVCRW